jgi:hypothetical protein
MIRHYVARRAQVTEGHPHNVDERFTERESSALPWCRPHPRQPDRRDLPPAVPVKLAEPRRPVIRTSPWRPAPRMLLHRARCPGRPSFPRGASLMTCRGSAECSAGSSAATPGLSELECARGEPRYSRPGAAQDWVTAGEGRAEGKERHEGNTLCVALLQHRQGVPVGQVHGILHACDVGDRQRVNQVLAGDVAEADAANQALVAPSPSP